MSRAYSSTPIDQLSDTELREILLTCDGRGNDVKTLALGRLLDQAYRDGVASVSERHDYSSAWERGEQ